MGGPSACPGVQGDIRHPGGGTLQFLFSTEPTHRYQIESSADLAAWAALGSPVAAVAATTRVELARGGTRRFWRARLVQP